MHEIFDHTADLGLRVRAATLTALLADAAVGLLEILAGDLGQIRAEQSVRVRVDGVDPTWLLFDLTSETLSLFNVEGFLGCDCEVALDSAGLDAIVTGEPFDPARHLLAHEIKAVTHHGLDVHRTPQGWEATFIVDI